MPVDPDDTAKARMQNAQSLAGRNLANLISLAGKTAVVTGAARGIGLAIAHRLAEAGARVMMGDLDQTALDAAIAAAPTAYRALLSAQPTDMRDVVQIAALAEAATTAGGLDIWVNNAGVFPRTGPIAEADDRLLADTLAINVAGPFAAAREAARRMLTGGVIINMSSTGGLRGQTFMTGYSASKHALIGLTRSLALELGPQGIRVVGIAPGLVLTPGVSTHLEALRKVGGALQRKPDEAPLGRPCVPDDVARVALFLASDLAAMVSGVIIPVDGGSGA